MAPISLGGMWRVVLRGEGGTIGGGHGPKLNSNRRKGRGVAEPGRARGGSERLRPAMTGHVGGPAALQPVDDRTDLECYQRNGGHLAFAER